MHDKAMFNSVDHIAGNAFSGHLPGGAASSLMNPVNDTMSPLSTMAGREQMQSMPDRNDLADQMIAALQKNPERTAYVDLGGVDTRPGDLTAEFDPKMDQQTHLNTGRGDDMVKIV